MWRHASVKEARRVIHAGATASLALLPAFFALKRPVPLSVALLGALVVVFLFGTLRFQSRLFAANRPRRDGQQGLRVVVIGAGTAGAAIVREIQRDASSGLTPVAVLDDDPRKLGLSLLGVPVAGSIDELGRVVERYQAQRALLAIPSAGQSLVQRVATEAEQEDIPLQVLPSLGELMRRRVSLRDVRELRIEDLLGRQEVKTDLAAVHRLLFGRRVMVTGGGGSIGAEIARQVAEAEPQALILLDNDETHLHDAATVLDAPVTSILADVRDGTGLARIFEAHRPEIVFHAAAHKHVPILESFPCEAIATNALGTAHVVDAAARIGTERVVFISTDKAVRPTSVMGASKWLGEQIVVAKAPPGSRYCAVRFGNVLGSRGSVIPTFSLQIASGIPITVTDPRMTRYFMSIQEAVQLVLQAAVLAEGREVLMLEMGEPVNILELAKRMIRLSGYRVGADIPIEITGRREGEKLVEDLSTPDERREETAHESIVRLQPVPLPPKLLEESLVYFADVVGRHADEEAAEALMRLANPPSAEVPVIEPLAESTTAE
jgi:FlaA1/EpsC-like NDP-sugar epimerase